jgi:hypothetical protein
LIRENYITNVVSLETQSRQRNKKKFDKEMGTKMDRTGCRSYYAMILSYIARFVCSKINSEVEAHLCSSLRMQFPLF